MGKTHIRITCPCCGMQVGQNRLNRTHVPVRFAEVVYSGRGRIKWRKNLSPTGAHRALLVALKIKLEESLEWINWRLGIRSQSRILEEVVALKAGESSMTDQSALAMNALSSLREVGSYKSKSILHQSAERP